METEGWLPTRLAASAARRGKRPLGRDRLRGGGRGPRRGASSIDTDSPARGRSTRIWASRRIASTPSRHSRARRYARVPSIVLPSDNVPVSDVRSAASAQRSVLDGRPAKACISAPCMAIAGKRSRRPLVSNHSIQLITVVPRPLAQTGLANCNTRRATRSASPACWACSMAASGWPFVSLQVAARRCSSATLAGSRRSSSDNSRSRNSWW